MTMTAVCACSGCGSGGDSLPNATAAAANSSSANGRSAAASIEGPAAADANLGASGGAPLCVGGSQYTTVQDDEFAHDSSLNAVSAPIDANPAPSAMWSTMFTFGRTNNAGADDAFYTDPSVTPYYTPFSFSNGALNIEAAPVPAAHAKDAVLQGRHWLSGVIEGKALTYGYVEVSAIEPNLQGFWPAPLWLLGAHGSDGNGNGYSELDGNELFGNALGQSVVQQTQILNNANPRASRHVRTTVGPDPSTAFHTYGILWTPATVSFYIDRVATSPFWANAATGPMNPIVNLQVFTPFTWGPPPANSTPQSIKLQYFRWYQTTGASCSPAAVSTPLPPDAKPTPTPTFPPETSSVRIVQPGPVQPQAAYGHVTGTLKNLPAGGDVLLLTATPDNALTVPPGWTRLDNGRSTLTLLYGIVGRNGLTAATSYDFGGYTAVTQLFEIAGVNPALGRVSTDPTQYGMNISRNLAIPNAGGLGLIVWGARTDTANGGLQGINDTLSTGEVETRLTNSINNAMAGGSALSLAVSALRTDPFRANQPFTVTGNFSAGNAPNLTKDGFIIWLDPN